MPCGWEGNRRSGVALAMRHRLQWYIHLRDHGLRKGDEHPAYALLVDYGPLPYYLLGSRVVSVLDSGAEGPGFKSQPRRCRVTVIGKLFTPIMPLFTKQRNW